MGSGEDGRLVGRVNGYVRVGAVAIIPRSLAHVPAASISHPFYSWAGTDQMMLDAGKGFRSRPLDLVGLIKSYIIPYHIIYQI